MQTSFMLLQHYYARRYHLEVKNKYPLSLHWLIYTHISFWEGNSRIEAGKLLVKKKSISDIAEALTSIVLLT